MSPSTEPNVIPFDLSKLDIIGDMVEEMALTMSETEIRAALKKTGMGDLYTQYESRAFPKAFQAFLPDPVYVPVTADIYAVIRRVKHQVWKDISKYATSGKAEDGKVAVDFAEAVTQSLEFCYANLSELSATLESIVQTPAVIDADGETVLTEAKTIGFSEEQLGRIVEIWPNAFDQPAPEAGEVESAEKTEAEGTTTEESTGENEVSG